MAYPVPVRSKFMGQIPYVSFALYGRNDQYTPNYLKRVNRATLCLARQLERAAIPSEIIFNPSLRRVDENSCSDTIPANGSPSSTVPADLQQKMFGK